MCAHITQTSNAKKILMVIAEKNFQDKEFATPKQEFELNGFNVVVASTSSEEAIGKFGAKVKPDIELLKVNFLDYDVLVVVGGPGSKEYLWNNKSLLSGVNEMFEAGKIVSAICASPVVLARSGILKGKKATVYPATEEKKEIESAGAFFTGQTVTVDGKIVTGNGPESSKDFAREIISILK